jgi:hypothetical protein
LLFDDWLWRSREKRRRKQPHPRIAQARFRGRRFSGFLKGPKIIESTGEVPGVAAKLLPPAATARSRNMKVK